VRAFSSWGFSIAERTLSPTLSRTRERKPTAFAAAIEPDLNTQAMVYETFSARL